MKKGQNRRDDSLRGMLLLLSHGVAMLNHAIVIMFLPWSVKRTVLMLQVLEYVINVFKAEKYNQNKTLFLFGSYTIGKERLFLEAAKMLQQKVLSSLLLHVLQIFKARL